MCKDNLKKGMFKTERAERGNLRIMDVLEVVAASVRDVLAGMYAPGAGEPDLAGVGEGDDDSPLLKLIGKHQGKLLSLLDRLERLKARR